MYQIFPDRFARDTSDTAQRGIEYHRSRGRQVKYHEGWNEPVDWQPNSADGFYFPLDFYGGTLRGIESRLPYLQALGVGVIYLNPIFEACSNHRYGTGRLPESGPRARHQTRTLSGCAKAPPKAASGDAGRRFPRTRARTACISTASPATTARGAYNAGEASPYYSWYDFRKWPGEYRCWWNFPDLPEVDENDARWREFVISGEDSVVAHLAAPGRFRLAAGRGRRAAGRGPGPHPPRGPRTPTRRPSSSARCGRTP